MMQSFAMMAVITVIWAIVGYSLAFGSGNSFIGGLHNLFLRGVGAQPDSDYSATIPIQTYMVFQPMFAIITPALITGAFERMKFSAMLAFLTLWSLLVYDRVLNQLIGVAIAWASAIVGTLIILKVVDLLIGLRVSSEDGQRVWTSRSTVKRDIIGAPPRSHTGAYSACR